MREPNTLMLGTFHSKIKVINVKKINIANNPTYVITKHVPLHKFDHCLELLGVKSGED